VTAVISQGWSRERSIAVPHINLPPKLIPNMTTVAYANGYNWGFKTLLDPTPASCGFDVLIVAFLYTTNQVAEQNGKPQTSDGFLTFYYGFEMDAGSGNAYTMDSTYAAWLKAFQLNGGKVLISIGGAAYWGAVYTAWSAAPETVASNLISFLGQSQTANGFAFDGVDIDYEDSPALVLPNPATNPNNRNQYDGVDLMIRLTNQIVKLTSASFIITHAPEPQYLTNMPGSSYNISGYIPILATVGANISWLNVQMYNQDVSWLNAAGMSSVFSPLLQGTATAVYLGKSYTVAAMLPKHLAIGKPLESTDASNYMLPAELPLFVQQVFPSIPHSMFPIMFWALNTCGGSSCSAEQSTRLADIKTFTANYRQGAGLHMPSTAPLSPYSGHASLGSYHPGVRTSSLPGGCVSISVPGVPGTFKFCAT